MKSKTPLDLQESPEGLVIFGARILQKNRPSCRKLAEESQRELSRNRSRLGRLILSGAQKALADSNLPIDRITASTIDAHIDIRNIPQANADRTESM